MPNETEANNKFRLIDLLKVEASGVRTSVAAVLPLIVGQLAGFSVFGLYVGIGGLYLAVCDKEGSTIRTLLLCIFLNALAIYTGTVTGNYIVPSLILLPVFAFAGGMAAVYGEVAGQMGFVFTLAFSVALGQPGSSHTAGQDFAAFLIGGAFGLVLTGVLWLADRKTSSAIDDTDAQKEIQAEAQLSPFRVLIEQMTWQSIIFRHAMRLSIAATIAMAAFKFFQVEHGSWLIITALVIVKPVFADTRRRALERLAGSVLGGIVAVIIAALVQSVPVMDGLLMLFSILAFSHVRTNYGLYAFFLTPFVVLMLDTVAPGDWQIALVRIADTLIGGGIALTVSYALRPRPALRDAA